ncbi:MAG TPA: D-tyrosyl-tRNA(Tyr) deacylase [Methanotrichaceae archaeon]|nr:D-tyrosyl-tRNA(Tyr) deacylase [Methanotrichaceae archaeon]
MIGEIVVVATRTDPASINITERLMELAAWDDKEGLYHRFRNYRLVVLQEKLITLRDLEERLKEMDLYPDLLVFASRHQARDGTARLCGHFLGNSGEAVLGGESRELAAAAPGVLKSFILNLANEHPDGFEITVEATHHGPTDLLTPSFFAEIGSTKEEWSNPDAGNAVARSILELEDLKVPAFLGFGGGHYVRRQNRLLFDTKIAFGHLFSNYQAEDLDLEMVKQASLKSGAVGAYLDRKSLRSAEKRKISEALDEIGLEMMNERDIRERYPLDL